MAGRWPLLAMALHLIEGFPCVVLDHMEHLIQVAHLQGGHLDELHPLRQAFAALWPQGLGAGDLCHPEGEHLEHGASSVQVYGPSQGAGSTHDLTIELLFVDISEL